MLLLVAENSSAAHVEKVIQKYRSVKAEEENDRACAQREQRYFRGRYDERGMYRFQGACRPRPAPSWSARCVDYDLIIEGIAQFEQAPDDE